MSCGVGCSDPELLWLWRRLVSTALIRPLAWEPPYATGAALEKAKRQKKKKKKRRHIHTIQCWRKHTLSSIAFQSTNGRTLWCPSAHLPFSNPTAEDIPPYLMKVKKSEYTRLFTASWFIIIHICKQWKYPVKGWLNTKFYVLLKNERGSSPCGSASYTLS